MYGIASAPGIFQREMEIIQGIPYVACYLDDILIGGIDYEHHCDTLRMVLQKLKDFGLAVNKDKCLFVVKELAYLGWIVNKDGVRSDPNKVEASLKARRPTNVKELQSFLGMVTLLSRFIPQASTILFPLNQLLTKSNTFEWSMDCENAFGNVKQIIATSNFLVHFDPNKKLKLCCDASPYGIGAVLLHEINGVDHPIAFVSRFLTTVEKKYAQIDREALAIVFGLVKFHKYLYRIGGA